MKQAISEGAPGSKSHKIADGSQSMSVRGIRMAYMNAWAESEVGVTSL